mgnify:CR=1 FL=1|jgi:pentatricopeptide repeat protein
MIETYDNSETLRFLTERGTYSVIIIGMGGSGKTATAWSLFDTMIDGEIMPFCYPPDIIEQFPGHMRQRIHPFDDWGEVVNRPGNILYDDSVLAGGARSSATRENRDTQANMTIARHNDKRIWWTVQNTALLDKLAWQPIEPIMLHKWMPLEQLWTERDEMLEGQQQANYALELVVDETGADMRSLVYSSKFDEVLQLYLPVWWNEAISKPYRGYYVRDGQVIRA